MLERTPGKRPERRHRRLVSAWLALLAVEAVAIGLLAVAGTAGSSRAADRGIEQALVSELRLTDLALWPEASYCRHPSQADLFAPHAVHPAALEAFPAGSFVPPPSTGWAEGPGPWTAGAEGLPPASLRAGGKPRRSRVPRPRAQGESPPTAHRPKPAPARRGGGP